MSDIECKRCRTMTDALEIFPGNVCLSCWAASPAGRYIPTASELVNAWGGSSK